MSLEESIKENTTAVKLLCTLIAALPVGVNVPAPQAGQQAQQSIAKPDEDKPLSYDEDVRKPFLALLNSNRPGAMKVLADLGVANLKGFEGQTETYADLVRRIKEAQNG